MLDTEFFVAIGISTVVYDHKFTSIQKFLFQPVWARPLLIFCKLDNLAHYAFSGRPISFCSINVEQLTGGKRRLATRRTTEKSMLSLNSMLNIVLFRCILHMLSYKVVQLYIWSIMHLFTILCGQWNP